MHIFFDFLSLSSRGVPVAPLRGVIQPNLGPNTMRKLSGSTASPMPDTMTELYTISRAISQARTPDAVLTALRLNRNLRECHRSLQPPLG